MTSAEVASGEAGQRHDRLLDVVVDILETDGYDAVQPVADLVPHMRADIVFGGLAGRLHLRRGSFRRHRQRSQHLVRHRMSDLLLDTHVLLWLLDDSPRLGSQARNRITGSAAVYVSAASTWELAIKAAVGKITLPDDLEEAIDRSAVRALPVTRRHTLASDLMALPDAVDARL